MWNQVEVETQSEVYLIHKHGEQTRYPKGPALLPARVPKFSMTCTVLETGLNQSCFIFFQQAVQEKFRLACETIDGLNAWLEKIEKEIASQVSHQSNKLCEHL